MTIQQLAQQALDVQDACNLSGVVSSFAKGMDVIWSEARRLNHGTDWVNKHPISVLFADKIAHLSGTQYDEVSVFRAYDEVRKIAEGK
jgi:hypothetical protein